MVLKLTDPDPLKEHSYPELKWHKKPGVGVNILHGLKYLKQKLFKKYFTTYVSKQINNMKSIM